MALNALEALVAGVMSVVALIAVLGLPAWLLTHLALGGARKTLEHEEAEDR